MSLGATVAGLIQEPGTGSVPVPQGPPQRAGNLVMTPYFPRASGDTDITQFLAGQNGPVDTQVSPTAGERAEVMENILGSSLTFEANRGQTDASVDFIARGPGYALFLTPAEATLHLQKESADPAVAGANTLAPVQPGQEAGAVVGMRLIGSNPDAPGVGQDTLPGVVHYLRGNDPSQWQFGVESYGRVQYEGVYEGIDLVYYGNQSELEYDFVLDPGADVADIALTYTGTDRLELTGQGDLILHVGSEQVTQHAPFTYQVVGGARVEVPSSYVVDGDQVSFAVGSYDPTLPLVIDPVLVYSTYHGGTSGDLATGVAIDAAGVAYVAGSTISMDLPGSPVIGSLMGPQDAFATKFSATGVREWSAYIGGTGAEAASEIGVDGSGVYVTGATTSLDFPVTLGVVQPFLQGPQDAFIIKLSLAGTLGPVGTYATYLGGNADLDLSGADTGNTIVVGAGGTVFVGGVTVSPDFPTTASGFQTLLAGGSDGFVSVLNAGATALLYSTRLGGAAADTVLDLAVGVLGGSTFVHAIGSTTSDDFPVSAGAFQTALAGPQDAFVVKLNPSLAGAASRIFGTYVGGTGVEGGNAVTLVATGGDLFIYIAGFTSSTDFPVQVGAYQPTLNSPFNDGFVSILNPTGTALPNSTYLGGDSEDFITDIAVDFFFDVYLIGGTNSVDLPPADWLQPTYNGGQFDAFYSVLEPNFTFLWTNSYLGGNGIDTANNLALREVLVGGFGETLYIVGEVRSTNFPTAAAAQPARAGVQDGYIMRNRLYGTT
jgi:hypothetical protein